MSSEQAFEVARLLAKVEGIPGGISTGANAAAALSIAERYVSSDLFVDPAATTPAK